MPFAFGMLYMLLYNGRVLVLSALRIWFDDKVEIMVPEISMHRS